MSAINSHPHRPAWPGAPLLLACALVWMCTHGIAFTDYREFKALISSWTLVTLPPEKQYLYSSPLMASLGRALAPWLGAAGAYALLSLGGLAFWAWALHRWLLRNVKASTTACWLLVLSTSLPMVLFQWIGKSDAYLLGAWLMLCTTEKRASHAVLAFAMVMSHRELALLILALQAALEVRVRFWAAMGAALGLGVMLAYHHALLNVVPVGRVAYATQSPLSIPMGNMDMWPAMLACALSWFWLPCLLIGRPPVKEWLLMAACVGVACMTLDHTRVFSVLSMPLVLASLPRIVARLALMAHGPRRAWHLGILILAVLPSAQLINFDVKGPRTIDNIEMLQSFLRRAP